VAVILSSVSCVLIAWNQWDCVSMGWWWRSCITLSLGILVGLWTQILKFGRVEVQNNKELGDDTMMHVL
jgi:hypothetical protein